MVGIENETDTIPACGVVYKVVMPCLLSRLNTSRYYLSAGLVRLNGGHCCLRTYI